MKANNQSQRSAVWRSAMTMTSLGWDLALPIFGGVLLGHLLDRRLGTRYIFTLGLLMAGIFTGFYNVFRSIQRIEAREQQRARQKAQESQSS